MAGTLVFAHGFHLYAKDWKHIVWGDPRNGMCGRIPRAIEVWHHSSPDEDCKVMIGSGGSMRAGLTEAEISYAHLVAHMDELPHDVFEDFKLVFEADGSFITLVTQAENTRGEIAAAFAFAVDNNLSRIVLVSTPTHIPRCLLDAEVLRLDEQYRHLEVYARASDTFFDSFAPQDTVVVEPPHRGDMPQVAFHTNARRIFQFLRHEETALGFNEAWGALIDQWEEKLPS